MPISEYNEAMARVATMSDVFSATEPRRREILVLLRAGERPVAELAHELRMIQPSASKHLRALREVGLVQDLKQARQVAATTGGTGQVVAGRPHVTPLPARWLDGTVHS